MKSEWINGIREGRSRLIAAAIILAVVLALSTMIETVVKLRTAANDRRVETVLSELSYTESRAAAELTSLQKLENLSPLSHASKGRMYCAMAELSYMAADDVVYNRYIAYARFYLDRVGEADSVFYLMNKYIGRLYANGSYEAANEVLFALDEAYDIGSFPTEMQAAYYLSYADVLEMTGEEPAEYLAKASAAIALSPENGERKLNQAKYDLLCARELIHREAFESAREILSGYSETDDFGLGARQVYVVCDFQIPYFELMAKLNLHDRDMDAAWDMTQRYIAACNAYDFRIMKQNLLRYMAEHCPPAAREAGNPYTLLEGQAADENLSDISARYGQLLLENISSTLLHLSDEERHRETTIRNVAIAAIVFCAAVLLFCAVSILLDITGRDALTRLDSRKKYDKLIDECIKKRLPYCLLILDIDDFKHINDTFGHAKGDEVLRAISDGMLQYAGRGISACRYGGEELCMLFLHVPEKRARDIAEDIRSFVETKVGTAEMRVTVSGGFAVSQHGENVFPEADGKLYEAKANGKNQIR